MKLYDTAGVRSRLQSIDLSELSVRLLANLTDVFIIYTIFALVRWFLFKPMQVHLAYMLMFSIAGTLVAKYLNGRQLGDQKEKLIIIGSGVIVSLLMAVIISAAVGMVGVLLTLIAFLALWGRAVSGVYTDLHGVFSIERFYGGIALLGAADTLIYMLRLMGQQQKTINSCAVLYVVISLYLLSTLKSKTLYKSDSEGTTVSFDLAATVITLLLTLIFSSKTAMNIVISIMGFLYKGVVYLVGLIAIPVGYIAVFVLEKVRFIFETFWSYQTQSQNNGEQAEAAYNDILYKASMERFIHFVALVILIIAVIAAVYYIYKAMTRYFGISSRKDFDEKREFIVGFRQLGESIPKGLGSLKDKYASVVDRLLFNFKASNSEKIRHEYRKFIKLVYSKELALEGSTAYEICNAIIERYPQVNDFISFATRSYEDIRYGIRESTDEELLQFKTCLKKIINVIE